MSSKKYMTMLTTKITSPHSPTIAKRRQKPILQAVYESTEKYKIWKHFFHFITKLNSAAKMTSTNCVLIVNALVKDKKVKKLLLTIHITLLNEIWKARSLLKHKKKTLTNDVIIKKINTKLREIIKISFQKHLREETLENFQKNFLHKRQSMFSHRQ